MAMLHFNLDIDIQITAVEIVETSGSWVSGHLSVINFWACQVFDNIENK